MHTFLTSLSEQEFKDFLRTAIRDILKEELSKLKTEPSEPYDVAQAARYLKMAITTLYEKTSRKLIPHSKKGGRLIFFRDELEGWLKKGKVNTQSEIEGKAATYLLSAKDKKGRHNS